MRKPKITAFAVAGLVLAACGPEEPKERPGTGQKDEVVTVELQSDPLCGEWRKGDTVSLFDNLGSHMFTAVSDGPSVEFEGSGYLKALNRVVLFPYDSLAVLENNTLTVDIPSQQSVFRGISVASGSSRSLKMSSAVACLSFRITSPDVSSVVISSVDGSSLAGSEKIVFNENTGRAVLTPVDGGGSVELVPVEGERYLSAGEHSVAVMPGSVNLKIRVSRSCDRSFEKEFPAPADLVAGKMTDIGVIEDGTEVAPDHTVPEDITLLFMTEGGSPKFTWPFASPSAGEISSSIGLGLASFPSTEVVMALPESSGGYEFKVFGTTGMAKNSSSGFRVGGSIGDYIELPVIPGLYLTDVSVVAGATSTNVIITRSDGSSVIGGAAPSMAVAGAVTDWTLYLTDPSEHYRISSNTTSVVAFHKIVLHYDVAPRTDVPTRFSPFDFGWNEAETPLERYQVIYKAHSVAYGMGLPVDYSGIGVADLEVPAGFQPIPLTDNQDFGNTVFRVLDTVKDGYLFSMTSKRSSLSVPAKAIDSADYSSVPELRSGLHLLVVQDDSLWVAQREGHDYGATRKEVVLVRDGVGSNGPCAPYSTAPTRLNCSYCETTDELKTISNIRLERDPSSTKKICLLSLDSQNNVKLSNISIKTPETDWNGDHAINITNCTNILCEDIDIDGTYSQTDLYGYGLACNNIAHCTFRRIHSNTKWGVFGNNNTQDSLIEDSDVDRYDTHCYGRDITIRNSTLTGRGLPVSSIFGTILLDHCTIKNTMLYSVRPDYNSYVDFDLIVKDCEITPKSNVLISLGRLDTEINSRPELAVKRWPNITIENLTVNVPATATEIYMISTGKNTYLKPLGYMSEITLKGLTFKYASGRPSARFYISRYPVKLENDFTLKLEKLSLAAPGGASPVPVVVNIEGRTTGFACDNDSDISLQ